jgi:hypothetical protein
MGIFNFLSSYLILKGGGVGGVTSAALVALSGLDRMALGYCGTRAFPPFPGMRGPLDCSVVLGSSLMGMTGFQK